LSVLYLVGGEGLFSLYLCVAFRRAFGNINQPCSSFGGAKDNDIHCRHSIKRRAAAITTFRVRTSRHLIVAYPLVELSPAVGRSPSFRSTAPQEEDAKMEGIIALR
jgi:hypothetical protein